MSTVEIHLVTEWTPDGLSVLSGGTDYHTMADAFDLLKSSNPDRDIRFVAVKFPDIIFTGDEEVLDLTEPA